MIDWLSKLMLLQGGGVLSFQIYFVQILSKSDINISLFSSFLFGLVIVLECVVIGIAWNGGFNYEK